jgi:glutamate-ammonia-ligase adenylyltransferase
MQDIELLAQGGALLSGIGAWDLTQGLDAAAANDVITVQQAEMLKNAYATYWSLLSATRLLSPAILQRDALGQAGAAFLARALNCNDLDVFEADLEQTYSQAADIINSSLAAYAVNPEKSEQ